MTNQAAQTMPELPKSDQWGFEQQSWLYTDDQMHQYARDYAAMLAAAPAASGGEDGPQHFDGHDHEGFPGGCERFGHSPQNCPSAASVSERARELLAAEFARAGMPFNAADCARGEVSPTYEPALRAIEQALTQQRGETSYDAGMAMHWIERYAAGIDEECQLDRIAEAFTTPQPSADAVRELVKRWREYAAGTKKYAMGDYESGCAAEQNRCADELESLLSAASGEGVGK